MSNCHPFLLVWKCRDLLREQRNDYDIFISSEDDMLIPNAAIKYWLEHNEKLSERKYNPGFLRIERKGDLEYITDIPGNKRLHKSRMIEIEENK